MTVRQLNQEFSKIKGCHSCLMDDTLRTEISWVAHMKNARTDLQPHQHYHVMRPNNVFSCTDNGFPFSFIIRA